MQDLVNLQETKKQLETDREKHIQELQELQDGLAPLQEVLKGKQEAKNDTVKKYRYGSGLLATGGIHWILVDVILLIFWQIPVNIFQFD